jgi:hypothetical protein
VLDDQLDHKHTEIDNQSPQLDGENDKLFEQLPVNT